MDLDAARQQMISQQLRAWDVLDGRVIGVMAALPRERFVAAGWQGLAYADAELPMGLGKTLAPPKIQGRALQALLPQPGESVLEIGSGTGYMTACLARLAGQVTGVELHPALAATARSNLAALGIDNAELLEGDGLAMKFPAAFDVVCLNGSVPDGTDRFAQMLTVGGRLFAVTGRPPVMQARKVTRIGAAEWTSEGLFETCLPPLENTRHTLEFVF